MDEATRYRFHAMCFARSFVLSGFLSWFITGTTDAQTLPMQVSPSQPVAIEHDPSRWLVGEPPEIELENFRRGVFQGGELLGGYLSDGSDASVGPGMSGGLDETFWEVRLSTGIPLGSLDNLLGVRPFFRADHLSGLSGIDAPETLYSTGVTLFHRKKWNERVSTIVIATPSVRSDFTTSDNAFRLFGLGLVNWQCREDLSLSLGAVYFDRSDLGVLPAFGLSWTPTPRWKIDLMMPRPQINRRLWVDPGQAEGWAFVGGSIGGNTWAVTREGGVRDSQSDELTVKGLRVFGGYETLVTGNRGWGIEVGYVFNRSLEYEQDAIEFDLHDAVFIEANWKF